MDFLKRHTGINMVIAIGTVQIIGRTAIQDWII